MIELHPPLRRATEADAAALADLVNFAGEGLPLHIWQGLASDDEDPWAIGRARQAEKARAGTVYVIDTGQGAMAALTGYVIGTTPEPIGADMPALFRPLQELENRALDSWYVNVLACYPEHRGNGLGSRLLGLAERLCRAEGLRRMSVIVADDNAGAQRLYERHGYTAIDKRRCVKNGWDTKTENWILLLKSL